MNKFKQIYKSNKLIFANKRSFCEKNEKIEKNSIKPKDKIEKIDNFYKFMEENMNNLKIEKKNNNSEDNAIINDERKLLSLIKCPMTDQDLEVCEEGLKVFHIVYPRRNGIYILTEEEAIFKF